MSVLDRRLIVPWIRLDQDAGAEEALALRRASEPWCAGFCLFGGTVERVARLTARLQDAADGGLLIASDMERGAGQQVEGLRVLPDAAVWGLTASEQEATAFGRITAREARSVGVNVLFGPVVDVRSEPRNPILGTRAFSYDPDRVAALGAAFVAGALDGRCLPVAKHFPGHGATAADSHDAVPSVVDRADLIEERDLGPFAAALQAGCRAVMTAHVAYPALDPSGAIATFSAPILGRLREMAEEHAHGETIAVFTDALLMAGAATPGGEVEAARRALRAGAHALLIPSDPERLAATLLDDVGRDLARAIDGADAALEGLRLDLDDAEELTDRGNSPPAPDEDEPVPGRVADRAVRLAGLRGAVQLAEGETVLLVDDDDDATRGGVLRRALEAEGIEVVTVRLRKGATPPSLDHVAPAVVVLFSSVRAWKGDPVCSPAALGLVSSFLTRPDDGDGEAGHHAPVLVALTPRPPPGVGPLCHVPGMGPDVEAAVADALLG